MQTKKALGWGNWQVASSPNFSTQRIEVEFLVVHYTACSLKKTLEIFSSPTSKVCSHFVIAEDGSIHDLGNFADGPIYRGAHAGKSQYDLDGTMWEAFNDFSIGIELVNLNGNYHHYPNIQYEALAYLTKHLISRFSKLKNPRRIVGHEHIAGFRGKIDPGRCFRWEHYFQQVYPDLNSLDFPGHLPRLDEATLAAFEKVQEKITAELDTDAWACLNSEMEAHVGRQNVQGF